METIKEFFQHIYDSSTERIKSPLIGSFIISFIIFNWRVFAILFYSDWPVHCRIEWIEANYCKWSNLLFPIGIALFYIIALPYINLVIDYLLGKYSTKRAEEKKAKRTDELHQERDYAALERQVADAKAGTSEINNLQARIESLQEELKGLTDQNKKDEQRWTDRFSVTLDKENDLNKSVDNLLKENNSLKSRINELAQYKAKKDEDDYKNLSDPQNVGMAYMTIKKTTEVERNAFLALFGEGQDAKTYPPTTIEEPLLYRFLDLGLVKLNNNDAEITVLGHFVLALLKTDLSKYNLS